MPQCDLREGEVLWFSFFQDFCPTLLSLSPTGSHGIGLVLHFSASEEASGNGRISWSFTPAGQSLWVFP